MVNKGLLTMIVLDSPLIRAYFLGGVALGGYP